MTLGEFVGQLGGAADLGGADWGEVAGVAEEEHSIAANPVVKTDLAGRGVGGEIGGGVANVDTHGKSHLVAVA